MFTFSLMCFTALFEDVDKAIASFKTTCEADGGVYVKQVAPDKVTRGHPELRIYEHKCTRADGSVYRLSDL